MQCCDAPLRHGEIRHAEEADGSRRPGLARCPFDQFVVVACIVARQRAGVPFGLVHAAHVGLHDGVARPRPEQRIWSFESRPVRAVECAESHANDAHQGHVNPVGRDILPVWRHRHHDGNELLVRRSENVGLEVNAVSHGNIHVLV
jgi:hypothetical protein